MKALKKMLLPPGPMIGLTLVGLLIFSAVLYYRAVHVQRFFEPALAISQPRLEFAANINRMLVEEFGTDSRGVLFMSDTILVDQSLMFVSAHHKKSPVIERLSRVFLSMLKDPEMRSYIELIMVCARLPLSDDPEVNRTMRPKAVYTAEMVQTSLYKAAPELEENFGTYFAATALPVNPKVQANWIEFRIIPTLRLHIDVLQRLEKYAQ